MLSFVRAKHYDVGGRWTTVRVVLISLDQAGLTRQFASEGIFLPWWVNGSCGHKSRERVVCENEGRGVDLGQAICELLSGRPAQPM